MRLLAALLVTFGVAVPSARADAPVGGVRGTVIFEGEAPDRPSVGGDKGCPARPSDEVVVTKGKLAGVVVRVVGGSTVPPPANLAPTPVAIDLHDCAFVPRIVALEPNQELIIEHATPGELHAGVPAGADVRVIDDHGRAALMPPSGDLESVVGLWSHAHPWMRGYAVLVPNRFHAVTGADGSFEILGLAPGTYTLQAVHPTLGTAVMQIVVGTGNKAVAQARLSYKR